jgi:asparagine synthase (glutamine-hydrolysing)
VLPRRWAARLRGDRPERLAQYLGARDRTDLFLLMRSLWQHPETAVLGAGKADQRRARAGELPDIAEFEPLMMALDCQGFLPEDILVKVDRAAMAASLETRIPLLDHRLVELAWSLPADLKMRGGRPKWALQELLARHVPRALTERPKMGFSIPLEAWLRGPLRGWAEDMLDPERLRREGYFDPGTVRRAWSAHLSGKQALQYHLWPILMFQAWLSADQGVRSGIT